LKKRSKKLLLNGFGLSAEAQPEFIKVFWFFFSKKNRFLCRLPFRGGDLLTWAVTFFASFLQNRNPVLLALF
jgi:hypothetical protein